MDRYDLGPQLGLAGDYHDICAYKLHFDLMSDRSAGLRDHLNLHYVNSWYMAVLTPGCIVRLSPSKATSEPHQFQLGLLKWQRMRYLLGRTIPMQSLAAL
jgi:hypothetical protein